MTKPAPAIELDCLGKSFRSWDERPHSLKAWLINLLQFKSGFKGKSTTTVLDNVSLTIHTGEFVGIMGPNGAGKSTILKLICSIYEPTRGTVRVHGQIAPLIELGAGFHPDLSGYDNVFLNAAILGFGRRLALEKMPEILEFAGLGEKIHMPVRYYSSGMLARLGFSVATHLPAPILLVDEILAVGDANFQAKCIAKVRQLHSEGRTVILVSHDIEAISHHCERVIVLSRSGVSYDGPASRAREHYLNSLAAPVQTPPSSLSEGS
jgi:ABC-type polysaccharide/polyol phosphate transport system ATPase subunit